MAPAAPSAPPASSAHPWEQALTGLVVLGPLVVTVWAALRVLTDPPTRLDLGLAVAMYALTGYGVTVGFHRLLTHRAFTASRRLRIGLAVAGSMAFQGPLVGWVADHRRHHAFTDRDGDPHSPHGTGGRLGVWRGALHAHAGWLFRHDPTDAGRYARDVLGDVDLRRISALFPLWCAVSLALPFALGWSIGGTVAAGASAMVWAGVVRIAVLHQVTWSINSLCHLVGRRPHATKDHSTNVAILSVLSMGESFHNNHHAFPRSPRHGLDRGQWDSSAVLITLFERLGWATDLHGGPHRPTSDADEAGREGSGGRRPEVRPAPNTRVDAHPPKSP